MRKALIRRRRAVASITSLEPRRLFSTVITVTTFVDQIDPPGGNDISLRDALTQAATTAGHVTVNVPGGEYDLSLGELVITTTTGDITVQPTSGTPILNGMGNHRVLHVDSGAVATLTGMEITGAFLGDSGNNLYGGGVLNEGTLTLTHSSVHDNFGQDPSAQGIGIYNAGTMVIDSTTILHNALQDGGPVTGAGGGIYNAGLLKLTSSTISGNIAPFGGGIDNVNQLQIADSTISNNNGYTVGGGIENTGSLTMSNSTVANNLTHYTGGGIVNYADLTLTNCTIVGNRADSGEDWDGARGGGVANDKTLLIGNTIVTGNFAKIGGQDSELDGGQDVDGAATSLGHNLIGASNHSTGWIASDFTGSEASPLDPNLSLVATHGGLTENYLPLPGSLVINHGSNALLDSATLDQRGFPRIINNTVDIGSVETQASNAFIAGTLILDNSDAPEPTANLTVYNDANNNGHWDAGELIQTTDDDGQYMFTGLPAGNYKIREILPGGARQVSPANGFGWTITLAANQSAPGKDFHQTIVPGGVIAGTIFHDFNGNGKQDPADVPFDNGAVYIDDNNDGKHEDGEKGIGTDSNGYFDLDGLPPGTYHIRSLAASQGTQTFPAGAVGYTITLSANQIVPGVNFGEQPTAEILGNVFNDSNGDGTMDPGETGLLGITIYNDANNNGKLDNGELKTLTDAEGLFVFSPAPFGSYKLREVLPAGWNQTTPKNNFGWTFQLASGDDFSPTFGEKSAPVATGSISGTIFADTNGNGTFDASETNRGANITLYNDANNNGKFDPGELSTTTDSNGTYTLPGLSAGNYKIREVLTPGWKQTSPANNFGWTITLLANQIVSNKNFGQQSTSAPTGGSISGIVFNDINSDMKQDNGEQGLTAWTVYIDANNDGMLDNGELNQATVAGGTYSFAGLSAGTYIIRAIRPASWSQTTPTKNLGQHITIAANQNKTSVLFGELHSL